DGSHGDLARGNEKPAGLKAHERTERGSGVEVRSPRALEVGARLGEAEHDQGGCGSRGTVADRAGWAQDARDCSGQHEDARAENPVDRERDQAKKPDLTRGART